MRKRVGDEKDRASHRPTYPVRLSCPWGRISSILPWRRPSPPTRTRFSGGRRNPATTRTRCPQSKTPPPSQAEFHPRGRCGMRRRRTLRGLAEALHLPREHHDDLLARPYGSRRPRCRGPTRVSASASSLLSTLAVPIQGERCHSLVVHQALPIPNEALKASGPRSRAPSEFLCLRPVNSRRARCPAGA